MNFGILYNFQMVMERAIPIKNKSRKLIKLTETKVNEESLFVSM